jgi:5'-nucleotidase
MTIPTDFNIKGIVSPEPGSGLLLNAGWQLMRILLTNDDGFRAAGICSLYQSLRGDGHAVTIVAPDRERSAIGHAITMHHPLHPIVVNDNGTTHWMVNGTPSDCVKIAVEHLLANERPELIISGINQGPNFGRDVLYSGTVAAALEGSFYNIPSLAASLAAYKSSDFTKPACFITSNLNLLLEWAKITVLNVNFPTCHPLKTFSGIRFTKLGNRSYQNVFEERIDPRGRTYFWMAGEPILLKQEKSADICAVEEGYISITPLQSDLTNYPFLEKPPSAK